MSLYALINKSPLIHFWWVYSASQQMWEKNKIPNLIPTLSAIIYELKHRLLQSHYTKVATWEILMGQKLRFGLVLGRLTILKKKIEPIMINFCCCFFGWRTLDFSTPSMGLKGPRLKLGEEKSRVEMSFNRFFFKFF